MERHYKLIIGFIIIVVTIIFLYRGYKKTIEFESSILDTTFNNQVVNFTRNTSADTLIQLGLNSLGYDSESVRVYKLTSQMKYFYFLKSNGMELKGFIYPDSIGYNIFIDNTRSVDELSVIISHELIHLDQYANGDLVFLPNNKVIWKGKLYDVNSIEYQHRYWENEAFNKAPRLSEIIIKTYCKLKEQSSNVSASSEIL